MSRAWETPRGHAIGLFLLGLLCAGCSGPGRLLLAPEAAQNAIGFLREGVTPRSEVLEHLGPPEEVYEDGQVLVYRSRDDNGTMCIGPFPIGDQYSMYALIVRFGKNDILDRRSIVAWDP